MPVSKRLMLVAISLCVATAWGQSSTREPHIGYLYPGGAQAGCVVQITAGGQYLNGVTDVYVCGEGVQAKVIKYIRPLRNLQKPQRQLLQKRLKEVRDVRLAEFSGESRRPPAPTKKVVARKAVAKKAAAKPKESGKKDETKKEEVKLPDHPLLFDMEDKSLRELAHISSVLFFPRSKLQTNRQLAEMVVIEVTVDPDAAPGNRELRLQTKTGLTNPVVFQVGTLPEARELEPNNQKAYPAVPNLPKGARVPKDKPLDLPVLLNGQIMPGDVDRFRFRARKGQQLVIEAQARSLIPYLADAVPGWFQATLALYDAWGKEMAFADDYRFNPDPVLFYKIPATGEYELEIRDSIYRGREDFVYRIAVSEQPYITQAFPLGGKVGGKTVASVTGWNMPKTEVPLDTQPGGDSIRYTAYDKGDKLSNSIAYAVDTLPECSETESNDTTEDAQPIDLPKIINGRIDRPGDVDVFRLKGRAGDKVVAEVQGRRLSSPLDSLLRLTDASGNVLEWNDDHVLKDSHLHKDVMGLVTHHADSYLLAELPQNGTYYVHLADAQNHGGQAYGYRLRVAVAKGDFALRVTPSSLFVPAGGVVPLSIHALRKDGFDGEIEVVLKDAPAGFELKGAKIPAGRDRVRMTLTVPAKAPDQPVALQLEGRARIGGQTVSHPAGPADNVMQAFLYRHLVPAQELVVSVQKVRWRVPAVELASDSPVRIPAGGTAQVRIKTRRGKTLQEMRLQLNEPPEGVTLHDVTVMPDGLAFKLKADKDAMESGFADNLIVEAFREYRPKQKDGTLAKQKRRYSMGFLPAIPIQVVQ
ncbi:MAG: hypothetical protein JSU70_04125 [Phycisphaerales bacterium]|nr:MAG: hypothetical protein JSU70_04125 [Phycisphaerales bacterium]